MSPDSTDDARELVRKMASLARLSIDEAEESRLGEQFDAILAQFQALSQLDVEGVEPMTGPLEPEDVLREDEPRPSLPVDQALANAPQRSGDFYGVPKTIGGES